VEKSLGPIRRAGQGIAPVRTHRFEDVLVRTRFGTPRAIFAHGIPDLLRDIESVLPGYFSSPPRHHACSVTVSRTSPARCGSCCGHAPEGISWDWPGDTEVILARKPG
jgi:hypothetical protein